ncbi:(p)ppGpp synthase/hydrolase [Pseudomonas syringae pv. actinidiae]|uniref:(P)ppGpp synthase/hydrolase n=1 Tax=Pseudomonas syringae pv. actinidiae TaxID=103796 RepID=A0AAN4Q721_PSESF|nr:(p)ppGpp synthase/hydrolase [Pseudomonas syringae pv. actinidiae]
MALQEATGLQSKPMETPLDLRFAQHTAVGETTAMASSRRRPISHQAML